MSPRIEIVDRARWRELVPSFRDYNYRQLWDFGVACAARLGATSEHVAVMDGSGVCGLADVRIKRIPLIRAGIAYIAGGPMVRRDQSDDADRLQMCLRALIDEYVKVRGLVLRILPPLGTLEWNKTQEQAFTAAGFQRSNRPAAYRTLVVDIDQPLEDIRKGFEQKWRNGLNRAERNGLAIRSGSGAELFGEFCDLYRQLLDRKGFDVDLDADFYASVHSQCTDGECFQIALVDVEGRPAAGHVSSMLGDTCVYLLGASNEAGMKSKASYLLQWGTIQEARARGCRQYDLGGIDPNGNPGVYHFKSGVGGLDTTAPGPFELPPTDVRRHIVRYAECLHGVVAHQGIRR